MTVLGIVLCVVALVVGVVAGMMMFGKQESAVPEAERQKLVEAARAEAAEVRRAAQLEAKELALRRKPKPPTSSKLRRIRAVRSPRRPCARRKKRSPSGKARWPAAKASSSKKEKTVGGREQAAEATARRAEELLNESKLSLEKLAGMTAEQAKRGIDGAGHRRRQKSRRQRGQTHRGRGARSKPKRRSKRILGTAIQRYAGEYVTERTVSVVPLPSDDLKGRIIGREGRNIRALEAATGIDLIIDDTPEAVIISCFNPLRREIAQARADAPHRRRAHPPDAHRGGRAPSAPTRSRRSARMPASRPCSISACTKFIPSWCARIGRLKFRSSYAQNLLQHSIEVGLLGGHHGRLSSASTSSSRVAPACCTTSARAWIKRSKARTRRSARSSPSKFSESPQVIAAIAEHHGEEPHSSVLSHIVDAANVFSGQRPGARQELLASYVQRLGDLEKLAQSFPGVERAYAILAGREIRVIVENSQVSDEQAMMLAQGHRAKNRERGHLSRSGSRGGHSRDARHRLRALMRILGIGDIIGKPGRDALRAVLPSLRKERGIDVVIANAENSAGGLGTTPETADDLFDLGCDVITGGNHTWKHREYALYLDKQERALRPLNYPEAPGRGFGIFTLGDGRSYAVINVIGRTFMDPVDNPFRAVDKVIAELLQKVKIIVVDMHAEASSEKRAMGFFLDGRASVVWGTHTHVPTADEEILPAGTGYLGDIGMTGPYASVIGLDPVHALKRFVTGRPASYKLAEGNEQVRAVLVDIDDSQAAINHQHPSVPEDHARRLDHVLVAFSAL